MGLKSFCTRKETIVKMKRQPTEWEEIFANNMTDKVLISKIYKQLIQLNTHSISQTDDYKNCSLTWFSFSLNTVFRPPAKKDKCSLMDAWFAIIRMYHHL